ncbi:hypothetical protein BT67DRAFT_443886 [Trichocladium antarcticum]|uniref:Uncharacterized protein n=1 Tax=Trichocladium antarcticum TaxID=1450529 RepID=A0AAN6ZBN3_9PEZI|nr:hypothetical protein BT67DRAFT_443886 [Trichocladium antarcticum]
MSEPAKVSHGRGGAANIKPDETEYVDGEVVRVGEAGSHGDGAFSTGRGGAANIGDAGVKSVTRLDKDLVPEAAVRPSQDANADYHTGRGGAGNEHIATKKPGAEGGAPVGLADKLKQKIMGIFKK